MDKHISFRWALFARILLLVIPVLLIGEAVMYFEIRDRMFDTAKRDLVDNAEVQALVVQDWVEEMQTHLITASSAAPVVDNDIEATNAYLKELITRIPPEIQCIHYTNVESGIIDTSSCGKRVGKNVVEENLEWFEPGARGEYYISNPFPGKLDGKPIFVLTAPVFKDGKQTHILSFHPNLWRKTANMYKPTHSGYTMLVDHQGTILTHPNLELIFKGNVFQEFEDSKLSEIATSTLQGENGFDTYKGKEEMLVGYDSITVSHGKRWGIFVIAPLREELEGLVIIKRVMTALMVVLISADLVVTLYIARSLARPLEALNSVVEKIRAGALSIRARENSGVKEIDHLAENFNEMVDKLETHSMELEDEVQERTAELTLSNEMKDLYNDILTHDLLNSVTVIQGVAELLLMDESLSKRKELKAIKRNIEKVTAMIENAQKLGKLKSTDSLEVTLSDLGVYIRNSVERVKPFAKERGIKLAVKLNGGYSAALNPVIEEVFLNLLGNAVKYCPEGSKVEVNVEAQNGSWVVLVKDNGEGIPDEYKKTIFERFRRKEKEGVKGTGLGLAIVKRVVDLHKGEVWVEDNPTGGSIFYVKLPRSNS